MIACTPATSYGVSFQPGRQGGRPQWPVAPQSSGRLAGRRLRRRDHDLRGHRHGRGPQGHGRAGRARLGEAHRRQRRERLRPHDGEPSPTPAAGDDERLPLRRGGRPRAERARSPGADVDEAEAAPHRRRSPSVGPTARPTDAPSVLMRSRPERARGDPRRRARRPRPTSSTGPSRPAGRGDATGLPLPAELRRAVGTAMATPFQVRFRRTLVLPADRRARGRGVRRLVAVLDRGAVAPGHKSGAPGTPRSRTIVRRGTRGRRRSALRAAGRAGAAGRRVVPRR